MWLSKPVLMKFPVSKPGRCIYTASRELRLAGNFELSCSTLAAVPLTSVKLPAPAAAVALRMGLPPRISWMSEKLPLKETPTGGGPFTAKHLICTVVAFWPADLVHVIVKRRLVESYVVVKLLSAAILWSVMAALSEV
jgi:hypothetical protein